MKRALLVAWILSTAACWEPPHAPTRTNEEGRADSSHGGGGSSSDAHSTNAAGGGRGGEHHGLKK